MAVVMVAWPMATDRHQPAIVRDCRQPEALGTVLPRPFVHRDPALDMDLRSLHERAGKRDCIRIERNDRDPSRVVGFGNPQIELQARFPLARGFDLGVTPQNPNKRIFDHGGDVPTSSKSDRIIPDFPVQSAPL
jgi:hypothetical protein